MIRAGILSDTHLTHVSQTLIDLVERAFESCDHIFHAGDVTDSSLLQVFRGKTIHAVHGNMCNPGTQNKLPYSKTVKLDGYTIGLCHGAGPRHNIEERMWDLFPEADCIIYGHTHQPQCEKRGDILFINPGCFQCSSPYGAPASYAILTIDETGLNATLQKLHNL